jgi:cytoskeletal protein CcmA (bactofilin family)
MFKSSKGTIIAEGLKIVGTVTAEGLVEVNGNIEGDLHCTSLIISPKATVYGGVRAERIVVNGKVEGPIEGHDVTLKSHAHVIGDIKHETLAIERGAYFDGRSLRASGETARQPQAEKVNFRQRREANNGREAVPAAH